MRHGMLTSALDGEYGEKFMKILKLEVEELESMR
jgi:hypothetical protein